MKNLVCSCLLVCCCLITFLLLSVGVTYAQFDSLGLNTRWSKGSIVLDNNSTLKGLIQYNDKLGMIKFRERSEREEESFVETSVAAMQLYDESTARWRNFASFNIREEQTGLRGAFLFEILMQFQKFALLSRVEKVNIAVRQRQNALGGFQLERVGHEQFERFFLVNDAGKVATVLAVSEFERNNLSLASKLKPYLDKDVLEEYLGEHWDQFRALVKSHKLKLKKRDGFIRAFEYLQKATE